MPQTDFHLLRPAVCAATPSADSAESTPGRTFVSRNLAHDRLLGMHSMPQGLGLARDLAAIGALAIGQLPIGALAIDQPPIGEPVPNPRAARAQVEIARAARAQVEIARISVAPVEPAPCIGHVTSEPAEHVFAAARVRGDLNRALAVLRQHVGPELHRYAAGRLGAEADAEDVLQRVYLAVHQRPTLPESLHDARALMRQLARLRCIDQVRDNARWQRSRCDERRGRPNSDDESTSPEGLLKLIERAVQRHTLLQRIAKLRPVVRTALMLRYGQELQHAEIGAVLGESEGTVQVRISRALGALRSGRLSRPITPHAPSARQ